MYGSPASFRPRGGRGSRGRGGRDPPSVSLANFLPENRYFLPYPSSSYSAPWQDANPNFQYPSFHPSQIPQKGDYRVQSQHFTVEMVDSAVAKAHKDLQDAGENVSVWKVSQSIARSLKVSSWDALGFRIVDLPSLRELQVVEGKVNAFIHCFVNTRKMTSVYELGLDICNNEGVENFEELGLGPLLRHPLIRHYFPVSPDAKEICKITTEDLVGRLSIFLYRKNRKEITVEEFLDFLVQRCSVASREHLGVRIRSMGLFIKYIRAGRRAENATHKSIQESRFPKEKSEMPPQSIPCHLKLSSLIDDESGDRCEESGTFDDVDYDDNYINREGMKHKLPNYKKESHIDDANLSGKELHAVTHVDDEKLLAGNKKKRNSQGAAEVKNFDLTDKEIERFVTTWKNACKKHSADEVLSMMIDSFSLDSFRKKKRKILNNFSSYPGVGLLNVAVSCTSTQNTIDQKSS